MKWYIFILFIAIKVNSYGQDSSFPSINIPNIELTDTIFMGYTLEPIDVYAVPLPKNLGLSSRDKLYLKKVYPYALRVSHLVDQLDRELGSLDKNRKKKKYINEMESMLKKQFTDDVKDLTRIQGQMLTKLIYRETNRTAFDLIKGYKRFVRYLDMIYQRDGIKEEIKNEEFTPPVQDKKRKRRRN